MFRKQNKTNAERERATLKMSAASSNTRGLLQHTKTQGRWQRIISLRRLGIYLWKMRRRVAKEAPLKHVEQMRVLTNVGHLPPY
jgi:hypothetical protein